VTSSSRSEDGPSRAHLSTIAATSCPAPGLTQVRKQMHAKDSTLRHVASGILGRTQTMHTGRCASDAIFESMDFPSVERVRYRERLTTYSGP
jgi:hypothetical protein